MTQLSVVIICKNEARNIAAAIESVLTATAAWPDTEILLVDSVSTDKTIEIACRYPIKIIQLDPACLLSPSAGRYVGLQQTQGEFVYFLDGDMSLDADWFTHALPLLVSQTQLAAVSGKCHEISYDDSYTQVVSDKPDRFDVGTQVQQVHHLGQSSLYRRRSLEQVGSFNPYLTNEEELELGLRLSAAGYGLQRIPVPMTVHKTRYYSQENPSGLTLRQIKRDWTLGRHLALGQVLRLLIGNPYLGEYLQLYRRALLFTGLYLLGLLSLLLSLVTHRPVYVGGWLLLMLSLFVTRALWKQHWFDTGLFFLDYLLSSYGLISGFFRPPPPASHYQPKLTVIQA